MRLLRRRPGYQETWPPGVSLGAMVLASVTKKATIRPSHDSHRFSERAGIKNWLWSNPCDDVLTLDTGGLTTPFAG